MQTRTFGRRVAVAAPPAPRALPAPERKQDRQSPSRIGRLPWFTATLCIVLIARFKSELAAATDFIAPNAPGHFSLLAIGAASYEQVVGHGEWWRLFTATALHGSLSHLIGNLVTLAVTGLLLEPLIGIGWFAAIYFTGAFTGALASVFFNPAQALTVGASGAIMAMLAALFTLSFHSGAARPNLMRRVAAGSLFPALIPSVTRGGAMVDVNAHMGGCMAGVLIAFLLLIVWREEQDHPPGRSLAAVIAGLWAAATIGAFAASAHTYVGYARGGLDYIPPAAMPKDIEAMKSDSYDLVRTYPKDPRAHLFRGLYFLEQGDAADAEPYFRDAMRIGADSPAMSRDFQDWSVALLALSVRHLGRADEARIIIKPLCDRGETLDRRTRQTLDITHLCEP